MREKQHILVTGAAGFIGSSLVDRLLDMGQAVIGVDNFDPFYSPADKHANLAAAMLNPAFHFREADCTDLPLLQRSLEQENVGSIVHLAAKAGVRPSIEDPVGYLHANVQGTQAILEFARRRGISRVIFASSSSVYGDDTTAPFTEEAPADQPLSPYAASKRAGELLCSTYSRLFAMKIIALRFFTVYGPRQRPDLAIRKFATLMLRRSEVPLYGDGLTARDYTWIDDIIDGVVSALRRLPVMDGDFEVINLGGNRTTTLHELIQLLSQSLGVKARIKQLPMQPGDVRLTYADIHKANRLLGYVPRTPIEDGITRFASWIMEQESATARISSIVVERQLSSRHSPARVGIG